MSRPRIHCWQPTIADHGHLVKAQSLYERTLDPGERIPWIWIERSAIDREHTGNGWIRSLILASVNDDLAGFAYGAFLPGFGGYLCYVTVDETFRQLGIATRLYESFFDSMRAAANEAGEALPFVLWESHRPEADANLWQARVKLFDRVGGLWLDGLDLQTPNYAERQAAPVPLQVFLRPMDEPLEDYDVDRLWDITHDLLVRVYDQDPGDDLYDATLTPGTLPRLVRASHAAAGLVGHSSPEPMTTTSRPQESLESANVLAAG